MEVIERQLTDTILNSLRPGFINIVYGPRRVGKTVLLEHILGGFDTEPLVFNGDTQETRNALSTTSEVELTNLVKNTDVVGIDEAQRIPNIALALKIIIDKFPKKKIFVTGSTSLELARGIPEELTGRTMKYKLYPLSTFELTRNLPKYKKKSFIDEQLLYGGYPYLTHLSSPKEKQSYLSSVVSDYLFRDILNLKEVTAPEVLQKLAALLAFQIGSEVSLNELANNLRIDIKTVERYLGLLKLGFIIFEIGAFSRNLRNEVSKSKKYYFWDLGIRNSLIGQFSPLEVRSDKGGLWENFLAVERKKQIEYSRSIVNAYFWRTYQQAEIDWIETVGESIRAYEFKWKRKKIRTPKAFKEAYNTEVNIVSRENYLDFLNIKSMP